jgi:hypothetical protein
VPEVDIDAIAKAPSAAAHGIGDLLQHVAVGHHEVGSDQERSAIEPCDACRRSMRPTATRPRLMPARFSSTSSRHSPTGLDSRSISPLRTRKEGRDPSSREPPLGITRRRSSTPNQSMGARRDAWAGAEPGASVADALESPALPPGGGLNAPKDRSRTSSGSSYTQACRAAWQSLG